MPPTDELARTLTRDTLKLRDGSYNRPSIKTHVRRMTRQLVHHGYGEPFEAVGHEVTSYSAGRVPGNARILTDDSETCLLYTADFRAGDQRLVSGTTARPGAGMVIYESTYSDMKHKDRATVGERLVEPVRTIVREGGTVVVPALAVDRMQKLFMVLDVRDIDCYVDGVEVRVLEMLRNHPGYVRDAAVLKRTRSSARVVSGQDGQRKRVVRENSVIVTASGMLSGGLTMMYVPEIRGDPTNKVCLTDYQVEGTPGRGLVGRSRCKLNDDVAPVAARAEMYNFSARVGRHGLLSFLDDYYDTPVLINHGDRCAVFAGELSTDGHEAVAPEIGATARVWDTPAATRSESNQSLPRPIRRAHRRLEPLSTGSQRYTRTRGIGFAAIGTNR